MLTWAITRAASEATQVAGQLNEHGVRALVLPCIECAVRPVPAWHPAAARIVMLTSPAAVRAVAGVLSAVAPTHVAALAPSTVVALNWVSSMPAEIQSTGGAVALAHAILRSMTAWGMPTASFWYPTSSAGLEAAEQNEAVALLRTRGEVTRVVAYDVMSPTGLADQLRALPPRVGVFFASPSAVKHFIGASQQLKIAPTVHVAACWGRSTYLEAQAHFQKTHLLSRAVPLVDALRSLGLPHA